MTGALRERSWKSIYMWTRGSSANTQRMKRTGGPLFRTSNPLLRKLVHVTAPVVFCFCLRLLYCRGVKHCRQRSSPGTRHLRLAPQHKPLTKFRFRLLTKSKTESKGGKISAAERERSPRALTRPRRYNSHGPVDGAGAGSVALLGSQRSFAGTGWCLLCVSSSFCPHQLPPLSTKAVRLPWDARRLSGASIRALAVCRHALCHLMV